MNLFRPVSLGLLIIAIGLICGCSKQTLTSANTNAALFPHTTEFKGKSHGASYRGDSASCEKCHDSNRESHGSKPGPACTQCHDFPHQRRWAMPANHGAEYLRPSEKRVGCLGCHDKGDPMSTLEALQPGAPSCGSCHTTIPHSLEFRGTGHAFEARSNRETCIACHADPKREKMSSRWACSSCHNYPHGPSWALPTNHGVAFARDKNRVGCLECHDDNPESAPPSCSSCHVKVPHSDDFKNGGHAPIARTYQGKCTSCHSDLKTKYFPTYSGTGCYTCHDAGPANDKTPIVRWDSPPAFH